MGWTLTLSVLNIVFSLKPLITTKKHDSLCASKNTSHHLSASRVNLSDELPGHIFSQVPCLMGMLAPAQSTGRTRPEGEDSDSKREEITNNLAEERYDIAGVEGAR